MVDRTFVTFRHWLLNYFVHDFIPSKALRFTLTSYLNSLPQHPLVRRSPRDQRIVKGLKRVVRRLKKVYYRKSSSNTHRVKVVRAPPPTPDQEKIEQMVRAKLSSHSLRKKTLAMGGNVAITDANSTPVVVVGSLRKKNGPFGSIRGDSPTGRPVSPARLHSDTVSARTIHMQHLQKQEEIERRRQQQEKRASVSSDESLHSMLTAGSTASEDESDETEETSDDTDSASGDGDQDPEDREVMRVEEERRRREEDEERRRAEFFGSNGIFSGNSVNGKRPQSLSRPSQHPPMPSFDPSRVERFAQPPTPSPPSSRPISPASNLTKNVSPLLSPLSLASSPYKNQSPSPVLQQAKLPPSPSPQDKEVPALSSKKYNKRPTLPDEFFAPNPLESLSGKAGSLASRDTNSPVFGRDSLTIPSDVASGRTTPSRSPTPQRSTTAPLTSSGLVASRKDAFEKQSSPSMAPSKSEMGRPSSTTPLYNMFARGESVRQRSFNATPEKDVRSSPLPGEMSPENGNLPDELRGLDRSPDYKNEGPPVGLARSLSKKSIERRRSEKSLKGLYNAGEGPAGPNTESVFARHAGVTQPKEFMAPLPPAPTPIPSRPELRKQQSLGNMRLTRPGEAASLPGPLVDYHHPNNNYSIPPKPASLSKVTRPTLVPTASITSKGGLAKAFGKMLKNSQESELAVQPTRQDFANQKTSAISRKGGKKIMQMGAPYDDDESKRWSGQPPSLDEPFGMYPAENSEQYEKLLRRTPSGKFVSLIAQELRKEAGVECDCDACRGLVDGDVNAECRRLSILATPEVRRSLELRHRRGASLERLNDIILGKSRRESGSVVSGVESAAGNLGWKVGRNEGTVAQRNSTLRNDRPVDTRSGIYSEISGSEPVLVIQEDSSDDGDDDEEEEEFIIKRDDDESTVLSAARKSLPPLQFGTIQDQRPGDRSSTVRAAYLTVPPEASPSSNPASRAIRRLHNVEDLKHVSSIKEVEDNASKNKTSWQSVAIGDGGVPANHAPYANGGGVRPGLVFNPGNTHRTVTVMNVGDTSSIISSEIPEVGIMRGNDVVLLQENKKRNRHPLRHGEIPPGFMESNVSSTVNETDSGMTNEAKKRVEAFVQQQVDVLVETSTSPPRRSGRTYSLPPLPKAEPMATIGHSGDKDKLFPTTASTLTSRPSYPSSMRLGKNQTMSSIPRHLSESNSSLIEHFRRPFILDNRSEFIAQQFCLIEKDVLLEVQWEELVHVRWTKMKTNKGLADTPEEGLDNGQEPQEADTRILKKRRKVKGMGGVEKLIERFNLVCQWVATEIVCTRSLEQRVRVIAKFIRIAQKCRVYSNFATLVQILLGLQSPSVSRLRRTWSRVGTHELKVLDELSAFTSPFKNWKHIRDNMNTVAEEYGMSPIEIQIEMPGTGTMRGFQDWVNPKGKIKIPFGGCIPFLGIFLSDLVFNAELPAYLESKATKGQTELNRIYQSHASNSEEIPPVQKQPLVNFHKHRTTATVIKRILTFQNLARRYPFEPDVYLYGVCSKLMPLEPDLVRELSKAIEED
ncbi:hypothetical protein BC937DRAFT_92397 [Endogone sp. FLAS-F59071]|nr:hypothetical protein BC937DRAFT_92397 [Endogone sp. FLAS-F59071]|eukprot:RUS15472.1 hypothetical protein BC937DRAFT_92397 [Endogone sp. FLAS-F59071]